jgi:hypothetical protein
MTDHFEPDERRPRKDPADPTENAERNEPMDPTDNAEPTLPMERMDPLDAIESIEFSEARDQRDDEGVFTPARLGPQQGPRLRTRLTLAPFQRTEVHRFTALRGAVFGHKVSVVLAPIP